MAIIIITVSPGESAGKESYTMRRITPSCGVSAFEILKGFSKLGFIVAYAYLCDRCVPSPW